MNPRVLVTGGSSSIAFNIVRCIRKVFSEAWIGIVDSAPFGPCFHTDLVDEKFMVPQMHAEGNEYLSSIFRIIDHYDVHIIIPAADHETLILAQNRDRLERHKVKVLVAGQSAVKIVNDKCMTAAFAGKHKIAQPKYIIAESGSQAEEFAKCIHPSLVVTKEISTINKIAPTPVATRELAEWFHQTFDSSPLIQEFIFGHSISVTTMILPCGKILTPIAMQKMATDGHGETLEGIVVEADDIKRRSIHVLKLLNWIGPAEVEWIVDSRDKQPKFLEINSRFPAWIYLTHWKGRNYPAYYVEYLYSTKVEPPKPPPPGQAFCRQPIDKLILMEQL